MTKLNNFVMKANKFTNNLNYFFVLKLNDVFFKIIGGIY